MKKNHRSVSDELSVEYTIFLRYIFKRRVNTKNHHIYAMISVFLLNDSHLLARLILKCLLVLSQHPLWCEMLFVSYHFTG